MRYVDFKSTIEKILRRNPVGMTWAELRRRSKLPYERPCRNWVKCLEGEIGLTRTKGDGRAYVWRVKD